ncbi:flagellar basal body protein [Pirellulaceae bacterium]|jgi:flagellar basal-body rod protein FlgB|nr:flagellar basal body protein [Pirellulaceae bacterium]
MIGKSSQIDQLSALLNQSQAKHEIISSNLANVNTPNFQTKDIRFDDVLSQISGIATPGKDGKIYNVEGLVARQDGNNVDVDRELSNMTKNALEYQTYTQIIASKLGTYRAAITGRS